MARVYQPAGRKGWYSDFFQGGKRVRRFLAKDKLVAQRKLVALLDDRDAARHGGVALNAPWDHWKSKYLTVSLGAKAKQTAYRDKAALDALERFYMPSRLAEVTPQLLAEWTAFLRPRYKPATVNRHVGAVKAMMRKAEEWGYLPRQEWNRVRRLRQARGRLLYWTVEQAAHLLERCTGSFLTMAHLGLGAGLRREEMYWLSWEDVDLRRGTLHVCAKEGWNPKDYEDRVIPLSPELHAYLTRLSREARGRWVLGAERPTLGTMSGYFRRLVRKAHLKGSLHTARHTFASHAVMAGVPLKVVSEWLGHADIGTTMIYAHVIPELSDPMIGRLPRFGGASVATSVATRPESEGGGGRGGEGGSPTAG